MVCVHPNDSWASTNYIHLQLAPAQKVQGGNEEWQLMSKLIQLTSVHFPDLKPNSYDNLNNLKLSDLNVSSKLGQN